MTRLAIIIAVVTLKAKEWRWGRLIDPVIEIKLETTKNGVSKKKKRR